MTNLTCPLLFLPSIQEMPKVKTSMQFTLISEKRFVLCLVHSQRDCLIWLKLLRVKWQEKHYVQNWLWMKKESKWFGNFAVLIYKTFPGSSEPLKWNIIGLITLAPCPFIPFALKTSLFCSSMLTSRKSTLYPFKTISYLGKVEKYRVVRLYGYLLQALLSKYLPFFGVLGFTRN